MDGGRLPGQRHGRVGVPGDHLLGLLASLLAHQVDHPAPLLALRWLHDIEQGHAAAGSLGTPAGIAKRFFHLRAFVDDDQEDAPVGSARPFPHIPSPFSLPPPPPRPPLPPPPPPPPPSP